MISTDRLTAVGKQPSSPPAAIARPNRPWHGRVVDKLRSLRTQLYGHVQRILAWAKTFFRRKPPVPAAPVPCSTGSAMVSHARQMVTPCNMGTAMVGPRQTSAGNIVQAPSFDPALQQLQSYFNQLAPLIGASVYTQLVAPKVGSLAQEIKQLPSKVQALEALPAALAQELYSSLQNTYSNSVADAEALLKALYVWLDSGNSNTVTPSGSSSSSGFFQGLETYLTTLIATKIQNFFNEAATLFQNSAGTSLEQLIVNNATLIGQTLSTRIATLLQATSPLTETGAPTLYNQTFEQAVEILNEHIEAIISVNNVSDPVKRQLAFSKLPACDQRLKSVLDPNLGVIYGTSLDALETQICSGTATQLMNLLLPSNGGTSGLVSLMGQLQIWPALQTAYQNLFQDLPSFAQNLCTKMTSSIEDNLANLLTIQIQQGLTTGLKEGLHLAVPPSYLNMYMVQGAFPAIFQALSKTFVQARLYSPSSAILKAFTPLASPTTNATAVYTTLIPLLYQDMTSCCHEINFPAAGVTQAVFTTLITPTLDAITAYFRQQAAANPKSSPNIGSWLRAFTQPVNAGNDSLYGQLVMDMLFKLGNLNLLINKSVTDDVCKSFQQRLSCALTSALAPAAKTEQPLVSTLVGSLNQSLGTETQVNQLLFGPALIAVDVSSAYQQQLANLGNLTHDLLIQYTEQLKDTGNWASKIFKGLAVDVAKKMIPSGTDLAKLFDKIYTPLLNNEFINESLCLRMQALVLDTLQKAVS